MTAHTPGPWQYQETSDAYTHIVRADRRFLCQLRQDPSGEAEANARPIAAAPDLLAALKNAVALHEVFSVEAARAAIAKAEGKS
jgi:hypothetical protein